MLGRTDSQTQQGYGYGWQPAQGWQCLWRTVRVDTLACTGRRHMRGHRGYNCCCVYGLVSGEVLSGNTGAESLVGKPGKERCNGDVLPQIQAVPKPQTKTGCAMRGRKGATETCCPKRCQSRKRKRWANRRVHSVIESYTAHKRSYSSTHTRPSTMLSLGPVSVSYPRMCVEL